MRSSPQRSLDPELTPVIFRLQDWISIAAAILMIMVWGTIARAASVMPKPKAGALPPKETAPSTGSGTAPKVTAPGITGLQPTRNAQPPPPNYVGPTENLTQVANALRLQHTSLSTIVTASAGLALTKSVCITIFYDSYSGRAYSNVLFQAYEVTNGNRFVFNDQEGLGTPRQATLRVQLFEPGSGGCGGRVIGTGFDLPQWRVNLDPLYDVGVRPIQVARIEDCPMLTSADVGVRWFSPDNHRHETTFRFGANKIALVPDSQWNAQAVSASWNYHVPNVGLYGFHIPSAPAAVNLIPAPLAAGSPMPAQEFKFQMNEPNRHCTVQVQYVIDRKIARYVDPSSPAGSVVPQAGAIAR